MFSNNSIVLERPPPLNTHILFIFINKEPYFYFADKSFKWSILKICSQEAFEL